jgi:hypothetical protein
MNTPTFIPVAEKRPKERTSVFLEPGSIETAAFIAKVQSAVNPERDIVSVSSVIRQAIAVGLAQLMLQLTSKAEHA